MSLKALSDYPAYDGFYHFVASTKYRKNMFLEKEKRTRLAEIISDICKGKDAIELCALTVAYNHVHILVQTSLDTSVVGKTLFGASSRYMRMEYPELVAEAQTGLWGGKSFKAIKDKTHLQRCISYIQRHMPDNTKVDDYESL